MQYIPFSHSRATTPKPKQVSSSERAWLRSLGLHSGQYLNNKNCEFPALWCAFNALYYCMQNPEAEIVNGWVLWKSSVLTELEFHTVVRVKNRLVDITKRPDNEETVLFLPDPNYWMILDKGTTKTFHNILFPVVGRHQKLMKTFSGQAMNVFENFEIKGKPIFNTEQKAFLKDIMLEIK